MLSFKFETHSWESYNFEINSINTFNFINNNFLNLSQGESYNKSELLNFTLKSHSLKIDHF